MRLSFFSHFSLSFGNKLFFSTVNKNYQTILKCQNLVYTHPSSPSIPIYLSHGTHIYNKIIALMRSECQKRHYFEVRTPLLYNNSLWKKSGHWDHYTSEMFTINDEILKPMNCPAHCLIYTSEGRSYKDLPLRFFDFTTLHRNELSGALTGLIRSRAFEQDDGHIFCTNDQIQSEIKNCLFFLNDIYKLFGVKYSIHLSTRPHHYLGLNSEWEKAEKILKNSLESLDLPYHLAVGEGSFYAPKIDIMVEDNKHNVHQCGTIQLDSHLPTMFKLRYRSKSGYQTPFIIHRAILGSIGRFMGILVGQYQGHFPFWLSPRQLALCSVKTNDHLSQYINDLLLDLKANQFMVETINQNFTLNNQIRLARNKGFNFLGVIGETEYQKQTINLRDYKGKEFGNLTLPQLKEFFNTQSNISI